MPPTPTQEPDTIAALPPIDLGPFLSHGSDASACARLASSLRTFGAALVLDARLPAAAAPAFRSLMQRYFAQPRAAKLADARPDVFYQVGVTPDSVERARRNEDFVRGLEARDAPVSAPFVEARRRDPKWRFFWRIGERPAEGDTRFPQLNAPQVVPAAFAAEWALTMDAFGDGLLGSCETVAEMLACGLGLERRTIADKLAMGPHLLAPTGADMSLEELSVEGATLAGCHYDLNVLTAHAASNLPGLYIWTRDGKRLRVAVPPNTLLIQAGAQLEHLTAGEIKRGFHEVIVSSATLDAVKKARAEGKSLWRVSTTFFAHCASDTSISPVGHYAARENAATYETLAGDQVAAELQAISLTDDAGR